jgi:hypothetical protein
MTITVTTTVAKAQTERLAAIPEAVEAMQAEPKASFQLVHAEELLKGAGVVKQ